MKSYRVVVTFEFDTRHPLEYRGVHSAGTPATAASRALQAARKAHPNTKPASIVLVMEPERS